MRSICFSASAAPRAPSSRSASMRDSRVRTSANSAATKKPLAATSTATPKRRSSSVISDRSFLCECYFEDRRRRSSADEARVASAHPVRPFFRPASGRGRPASALGRAILVPVRIASLVPSATEMLFALGLGDRVVTVTQEVCEVCAVSFDDVRAVAERLPTKPEVISLDPSTLGEVLGDIPRLAEAAGVPEAGEELVAAAGERLEAVERAVQDAPRPRGAALEWMDPIYIGGHWVPQMIELAGGEDLLGLPGERSRTAGWDEVEAAAPDVAIVMPCGYDLEGS